MFRIMILLAMQTRAERTFADAIDPAVMMNFDLELAILVLKSTREFEIFERKHENTVRTPAVTETLKTV